MRRRPSIALRLALGLSVMTTVLWLGAAAIAGYVMQRELNAAFDASLEQSGYRLLPLALHRLLEPEETEELVVPGLERDESYFSYYVQRLDGSIVVRVGDTPDPREISVTEGYSDQAGRRVYVLTDPRSTFHIVVFEHIDHRAAALWQSLAGLIWPLVALIPLSALGIWFAIRLALRPVERISRDIARRDRLNLTPIDSADQPVELAPIAEAVAKLLARLKQALDAERTFAASSAHELRTPISGALAQTQLLAAELAGQPGTVRLGEIERALRHLARLAEKLLQLSRLEAGFARSDRLNDLAPVLRLVLRDFDSAERTAARVFLVGEPAPLHGHIDVDAFAVALRNLIENALLHGASEGPVEVSVPADNLLHVANAGPVVIASTLADIAKPFVRGDTSAGGTGLGLAIVGSIMQQTGGRLELRSPRAGGADGFEAILTVA